jgi:hypothetical protein
MQKPAIDDILQRLHTLQSELEHEIDVLLKEKREQFRYSLEQGKVRFEQSMKRLLKTQRTGVWHYLRTAPISHLLSAPLVYSLIFPFFLLDMGTTLYQQICFRIYGIPLVHRGDYLIMDRQHLAYLNIIEKLNCLYCGYANAVIEYVREVAARTEQYWCPIKHTRRSPDPHRLSQDFIDYGDVESYRARLDELRNDLKNAVTSPERN